MVPPTAFRWPAGAATGRLTMSRVSKVAVAAAILLLLAGGAQTFAKSIHLTLRFHHRAVRAKQIRRVPRATRFIVVLKAQQRGPLATASSVAARARAQRALRQPLIAS